MELDFSVLFNPDNLVALLTLTFLEVVLGVDNIIFISILSNKLPEHQQAKARNYGLILAMVFRIGLLFGISWILGLKETLFTIDFIKDSVTGNPVEVSWKDVILILGGIFLIAKSTLELHNKVEKSKEAAGNKVAKAAFGAVIAQIIMVDMVFSVDSILTAVGLVQYIEVMIVAVVVSVIAMLIFAGPITRFINKQPSLQVLALAFLVMIGIVLIASGLGQKINKAFVYVAMAFSLVVEMVNIKIRKNKSTPPPPTT
jgi:predicted tellurium resistance membrane protein TerC